jgi:uncharacterized membrane protein YeiH
MFPAVSLDMAAAMKTLVLTLDLVGTFVFALSGATAGARRRLDIFGVLVLSFVAANSGGIVRDLLIGATPPAAISDWRYLVVSMLAGVVIFFWYPIINRLRSPVLFFDGVGLALFCVAGAQKALVFGLEPVMAALLGMLTGIGGGIARDVLLSNVPAVFGPTSMPWPRWPARPWWWSGTRCTCRPPPPPGRGGAVLRPAHGGDPLRLAFAGGARARWRILPGMRQHGEQPT